MTTQHRARGLVAVKQAPYHLHSRRAHLALNARPSQRHRKLSNQKKAAGLHALSRYRASCRESL